MLLRIVFALSFFAPFHAIGCERNEKLPVLLCGNSLRSLENYALLPIGKGDVAKVLKDGEGTGMTGSYILNVTDGNAESLCYLPIISRSDETLHSSKKLLVLGGCLFDIGTATTYGGQDLGCDPTAEGFSLRLAGDEDEVIEAGLGDDFKGNLLSVRQQKDGLVFNAKQVCTILGMKNTAMALKALDDDEKGITPLFRFQNNPSAAITTTERGLRTAKVKTDARSVYILPLDWRRLCYARCFEFEHCKDTKKHRAVQEKGYQSLSISSGSVRLSPLLDRTRQCPGRSIMCQTR